MNPLFVCDLEELEESVVRFMAAPEFWRDAIGSHPKYFVHSTRGGKDYFGLSKYVAFRGAPLARYVCSLRQLCDGAVTQKHICRLAQKPWVPYGELSRELQRSFAGWFRGFAPDGYDLARIHVLSLCSVSRKTAKRARSRQAVSPDELEARLREQNRIGALGERLVLEFEVKRLALHGIANPSNWIEQVSLVNVGAGYDVRSFPPKMDPRYIEVKATTTANSPCYLTSNQIDTLRELGQKAWLYRVNVKTGKVTQLQDPIKRLLSDQLRPVLFQYLPERKSVG